MLLKLYPENPEMKKIHTIVDCLNKGGVIIYPTDTVYAIGCDIRHPKALQKVAKIKGIKLEKANFSLICSDLSQLTNYAKSIDTPTYKAMKRALPGAFTFILNANGNVPKLFTPKKRTVGIRIPDNNIPREIVHELGASIVSTSVYSDDELTEYITDPELIYEKYKDMVDIVIDGGLGNLEASTVVDCVNGHIEVIREGLGDISLL
jgi:tRNA threonylcarbamoyl adenosine modification protein (Sua5/YciO/YrdC/YwlC family)